MSAASPIRILSIVEATTINAVAKVVLEFYRAARELQKSAADFPEIEGSIVTFERHSDHTGSPNAFVSAARERGLMVDVIPERRRFDLSVLSALRKVVEARGPDIVVSNSVKSHFVLWRSRVWQKYPWVAFHHGYTTTDRKMRLYNRVDRWSLPAADRLITVCHAFARELASNTGVALESILVQHNSIQPQPPATEDEVLALRSRFSIATDERIVLAVGRLSKEKAHIDLLAAFSRLRASNPEAKARLIIVGDGPERGRLENAADSFGCKESVVFAGQVSDVRPFYAAADVFALPSHSEGSPNVLLEAMAAEIPVMATKVGGVPEIVEDNVSALLVPANDPPALAAAIARVLIDSELAQRLTANASALVATRYTPENYVRSLTESYREIVKTRQNK
jgi:glycosyltransferase involved in cell wall biosynthesis